MDLLKGLDYFTIAAMVTLPFITAVPAVYQDFFTEKEVYASTVKSKISSSPFDGPTSKELIEGLIAEGYRPAIDLKWQWDHPNSRRMQQATELRLQSRSLEERNPFTSRFPMNSHYQALSEMLSIAEGTKGRYDIMFGGDNFFDYSSHPKLTGEMKSRGSAAGKHQVVLKTYLGAQKKGFFPNFTPYEQDRWFFDKIKRLGITQNLLEKAANNNYHFRRTLHKMSGTWSPMPQMDGTGKYPKQNPKPVRVHYKRFKNFLTEFSQND
jgi:muramidase (phage lysozyme)